MLGALDVPYRDTCADALVFALDEPPLPALAVSTVGVHGLTVQLRLLGASHQVMAGPVVETVACLDGREGGLPARTRRALPGWRYEFSAVTTVAADFDGEIARLTDRLRTRDDALSGAFPGLPGALTAIVLDPEPRGLAWRTWHTYPQTRELVVTYSRMVLC